MWPNCLVPYAGAVRGSGCCVGLSKMIKNTAKTIPVPKPGRLKGPNSGQLRATPGNSGELRGIPGNSEKLRFWTAKHPWIPRARPLLQPAPTSEFGGELRGPGGNGGLTGGKWGRLVEPLLVTLSQPGFLGGPGWVITDIRAKTLETCWKQANSSKIEQDVESA